MKHIAKALSFIFVLAALGSCSKSHNSNPIPLNPIVGKWSYSNDTTKYYASGFNYETSIYSPQPTWYFQFNSDGTGAQVVPASTSQFGSVIGENLPFTYKVVNSKLTLTSANQTVVGLDVHALSVSATMKVLTLTDLSLFFDSTEVNNGVTDETTEAAHFKKL
jgi:hypothetical protein